MPWRNCQGIFHLGKSSHYIRIFGMDKKCNFDLWWKERFRFYCCFPFWRWSLREIGGTIAIMDRFPKAPSRKFILKMDPLIFAILSSDITPYIPFIFSSRLNRPIVQSFRQNYWIKKAFPFLLFHFEDRLKTLNFWWIDLWFRSWVIISLFDLPFRPPRKYSVHVNWFYPF